MTDRLPAQASSRWGGKLLFLKDRVAGLKEIFATDLEPHFAGKDVFSSRKQGLLVKGS